MNQVYLLEEIKKLQDELVGLHSGDGLNIFAHKLRKFIYNTLELNRIMDLKLKAYTDFINSTDLEDVHNGFYKSMEDLIQIAISIISTDEDEYEMFTEGYPPSVETPEYSKNSVRNFIQTLETIKSLDISKNHNETCLSMCLDLWFDSATLYVKWLHLAVINVKEHLNEDVNTYLKSRGEYELYSRKYKALLLDLSAEGSSAFWNLSIFTSSYTMTELKSDHFLNKYWQCLLALPNYKAYLKYTCKHVLDSVYREVLIVARNEDQILQAQNKSKEAFSEQKIKKHITMYYFIGRCRVGINSEEVVEIKSKDNTKAEISSTDQQKKLLFKFLHSTEYIVSLAQVLPLVESEKKYERCRDLVGELRGILFNKEDGKQGIKDLSPRTTNQDLGKEYQLTVENQVVNPD